MSGTATVPRVPHPEHRDHQAGAKRRIRPEASSAITSSTSGPAAFSRFASDRR
jgi:hypothetical protein